MAKDIGDLFKAIGHFFKHSAVFVGDLFVKVFGKDVAHTFAVAAEGLLHSQLGKLAWTAVQEAEAVAAGVDKNAVAFQKIAAAAKAGGITAKDSIIKMLIEVAVQKIKKQFGPA